MLILSLVSLSVPPYGGFLSKLLTFLGIAALVTRDIAWTLWLNLAPNARRADGAALVSLLVFYCLLPLLGNLLQPLGDMFFSPLAVIPIYNSTFKTIPVLSVLSALAQAIAALWLFYGRWRKVFR